LVPKLPLQTRSYSEAIQALMEAGAVNHKTDDYPTPLNLDSYQPGRWSSDNFGMYVKEMDAVSRQEEESFNQKKGIVQNHICFGIGIFY